MQVRDFKLIQGFWRRGEEYTKVNFVVYLGKEEPNDKNIFCSKK